MEECQNEGKLQNEGGSSSRDLWLFNTHLAKNVTPDSWQKNVEIMDNSMYKLDSLDNVNRSVPIKQVDKIFDSRNDLLLDDREFAVDNLIETVDLSDLSFSSYNDLVFGDCNCFEDANQHVDPAIHVDGASLSFNNTNSVQLFKDNTNDVVDNYRSEDSLNIDNLLLSKSSDDCHRLDNYNFYHIFELIGESVNNNEERKNEHEIPEKTSSVQPKPHKAKVNHVKKTLVPIRKGRRYLPNFKQKVLEYTTNHTFKEAASHFRINCNTITEWSKESKRLSLQNKSTTSTPGSVCNYKTDIVDTPVSKTEIIFLNDEFSLETEHTETSLTNIEQDLPPCNMRSDERFLKWIQDKRLEKKELTRLEVYKVAKYCLKKCPQNYEKPIWFLTWFKRLNKALQNSVKINLETEKYIMYPNHFKLEVALYARYFTKNSAARVFNVPRRRMFDWYSRLSPYQDSFLKSDEIPASDDSDAAAKDVLTCDLYKDKNKIYSELYLWYQKRLSEGASPTSNEIKTKAREVFASSGIKDIKFSDGWLQKFCKRSNIKIRHNSDDRLLLWILAQFDNNVSLSHQQITEKSSVLVGKMKEFKGSKGWTLRFLKRHSNFLQHVPTIEDKLPQVVENKVHEFRRNVQEILLNMSLPQNNIGCMDEVALNFSYPFDEKSGNLPLLRKPGFENCQAVVILASVSDGRVLPPAVVFKGNGPKQLLSEDRVDILIMYQQDGLVDLTILEDWFQDVWLRCVASPNLLVLDSFDPHCSSDLRQQLLQQNCTLSVIPEGCSSQLQPLAMEVTPLFQESIKKEWKQFPTNSTPFNTKIVAKCQVPDQDTILQWIRGAYQEIQRTPISIINSFKITGLLK